MQITTVAGRLKISFIEFYENCYQCRTLGFKVGIPYTVLILLDFQGGVAQLVERGIKWRVGVQPPPLPFFEI